MFLRIRPVGKRISVHVTGRAARAMMRVVTMIVSPDTIVGSPTVASAVMPAHERMMWSISVSFCVRQNVSLTEVIIRRTRSNASSDRSGCVMSNDAMMLSTARPMSARPTRVHVVSMPSNRPRVGVSPMSVAKYSGRTPGACGVPAP